MGHPSNSGESQEAGRREGREAPGAAQSTSPATPPSTDQPIFKTHSCYTVSLRAACAQTVSSAWIFLLPPLTHSCVQLRCHFMMHPHPQLQTESGPPLAPPRQPPSLGAATSVPLLVPPHRAVSSEDRNIPAAAASAALGLSPPLAQAAV